MTAKKKKKLGFIISENMECLAIAIAMALILKFFIIEAYKIPSGSMQPTIFGNPQTGLFDRVLVNKFIYLVDEPERWDVIVFRFPLNQLQNYIKRLIGLPGEKVTIKNGDIYINDRIARKSESAVGSVMKKVYPSGQENELFEHYFQINDRGVSADGNSVTFPEEGKATISGVRDRYLHGYDPDYGIPFPASLRPDESHHVGDLRISFETVLDKGAGAVVGEIAENGRVHTFCLKGRDRSGASIITTKNTKASRSRTARTVWTSETIFLEPGRSYDVAFSNIDDRLSIRLDGEEVAAWEYETSDIETGNDPNRITFGSVGSGALFRDVSVFRDIYYLHESPGRGYTDYEVPENHYFALGDNTQNSSDGRKWELITLKCRDGRVLQGEYMRGTFPISLNSLTNRTAGAFVDIYGDTHNISGTDLLEYPEKEPRHFFHEKFLLGKAMAVFWPIFPHFRWKLIR